MDASYREPVSGAMPTSYAVLSVPPKAEMRKKGYDPDQVYINGAEAHPLAQWTSYSLPAGATYKDALLKLQEANKKPWGLLRARLHFSDGQLEMFERKLPNVPGSFSNVRTYDPNGVYHQTTREEAGKSRQRLNPRLAFLTDDRGHALSDRPRPRTFAPQELFKNCPPPVHSQCGYDFTPISHNSFLLKPADPPKGVRKVQSNFEHKPCDYRPRSYLREAPVDSRHCHCAEVYQVGDYTQDLARQTDVVNGRNRLVKKDFTHLGTYIPNSTIIGKRNARDPRFPCRGGAEARRQQQQQQHQMHHGGGGAGADRGLPPLHPCPHGCCADDEDGGACAGGARGVAGGYGGDADDPVFVSGGNYNPEVASESYGNPNAENVAMYDC